MSRISASRFRKQLTDGAAAAHVDEIRLPGEYSVERDRSTTAVGVEDDLWDDVQALAADN